MCAESHIADGMRSHRLGGLLLPLFRRDWRRRDLLELATRLEGGPFRSTTARRMLRTLGVDIGSYSYGECFTPGAFPAGTRIGRYVSIAEGVRAYGRNHPAENLSTHPFFYNHALGLLESDTIAGHGIDIGHDAWIGTRALFTPGCRSVGIGAIIGAGAVVTRDVPDFAIAAGNPARVIRYRFNHDLRNLIRASRWWDLPVSAAARYMSAMSRPLDAHHPLLQERSP